jgi:putative ABC transport system permease protein
MLSDLRFRVRALLRRKAVDAELEEELRAHLAHLTRKHEQAGLAHDEAVRRARLDFGGLDRIAAECRDARGVWLVEALLHDVRYAARRLRKDVSLTLIAVTTLALGIGASTTVFGVVDAILLKPLPYRAAERIVFPWRLPPPTANVGFDVIPWGRFDFLTFAEQNQTFEQLGAFLGASFTLTGSGEPTRFEGAQVSARFFDTLGTRPQLGRVFADGDDQPGHEQAVVLSDRLWRDRFGADRSVIGRAIILNGAPHTVVGVMPAGFGFPRSAGMPGIFTLPHESELWVPLALSRGPAARGEPNELAVIGRLAAGANVERAQSELDLFAQQMDRRFPQGKGWFRSRVVPMTQQLVGETRRPLLLLLGAVGVLLLITWSNVANLLLARSIVRWREFTLRAALGASRARLFGQLTIENLILSGIGGIGGVALARMAVELVKNFGPTDVPRLSEVRIGSSVLVFSTVMSLACGLALGLASAWAPRGEDLVSSLKEGGSRSVNGGSRMRSALLVCEVSLALVLMIASGLLVRTFVRLAHVDAGFNPNRALTFELTLPSSSYADADRIVALYRAALERLRALPGVESAGMGETVPMGGAGESTGLRILDRPQSEALSPPFANYTIVSPGYFPSVATALLRGRDFLESDTGDSMPVAIVNAAMARRYWPGQDAIGRQVGLPIRSFNMTVVGVVADVKHLSFREEPGPEIYVPYTQKPWPSMLTMHIVVRTRTDPAGLAGAVRNAIRSLDPDLPLAAFTSLDTIVDHAMAQPRFSMLLMSGFGVMSVLLACVGLYGAVSYSVTSRTQELGIRRALGAPPRRVFALVFAQCARIATLGIFIGVSIATFVLRPMAAFLYGVESTDPATFVLLPLLLLAVASLACYLPARRATQIDPMIAMRVE